MLLDTSGLLAALFAEQPAHQACKRTVEALQSPGLLSPFVLAELDFMITSRAGYSASLAMLDEVAQGAYVLMPFSAEQVGRARIIAARYRDLEVGLTDASIVVLAQDHGIEDLLTLDERHFRVLAAETPLRLLPADL
ncbi:MAG: PIN domain-containing protein [Sporichthyaceae bacterium]